MIVRAAHPSHYVWICQRAGCAPTGAFRAIEAVDGERILAMVGYDRWSPGSVEMHVAIDDPRAVLALRRPAFSYPFEEVGVDVVWGRVRSDNEKALRLDRALGFREVFRGKGWAAPGVDAVIFEMRRAECRWLRRR
jgi:RimJ/RimL family protein N-acetyltransferase